MSLEYRDQIICSFIYIPKGKLKDRNASLLKTKKINRKKEAFSNHKNEVMFSLLAQLCVGNVWM